MSLKSITASGLLCILLFSVSSDVLAAKKKVKPIKKIPASLVAPTKKSVPTSTAALSPVPIARTTPTVATANVTVDYTNPYTTLNSGPARVARATFGSVYTTFLTLPRYDQALATIPVYAIRYPGGSLAEKKTDTFSLEYPDLYREPAVGETGYKVAMQKGLTDTLAYATTKNLPFILVIPTIPYMKNVAQGQTAFRTFLVKLLNNEYGPIPKDLTFEIGNESSHYGWVRGKFTPGEGSYGYIANAYLTTLRSVLSNPTLNPNQATLKVAVQLGTTVGGQHTIYNQITKENLRTVDGFIHHGGLVANRSEYDFNEMNQKMTVAKKYWTAAWDGKAPEFKLIGTEWNVGSSIEAGDVSDYSNLDIGARQAGTVVKTFSQLIGGGADSAMIWGVQDKVSSMFYYEGEVVSHGGHAFRLMSESLVGTRQLGGKVNAAGNWTKSGTNFDVFSYRNDTGVVIFLTAGNIPDTGLIVTVNVANMGAIKSITTESITTLLAQSGTSELSDDRLYEEPVIKQGTLKAAGSKFSYRFTQDFEVARVIVLK